MPVKIIAAAAMLVFSLTLPALSMSGLRPTAIAAKPPNRAMATLNHQDIASSLVIFWSSLMRWSLSSAL